MKDAARGNASRDGRRRRSWLIREMTVDDLSDVFALGEKLFRTGKWRALRWTWDEYELVNLFATDGEFCLVAEQDHELIGFVLGSLLEKRKSAWTYGYVEWLGVDPDAVRTGVARSLMDRLTERFVEAGARMLLVDTDADNERGRARLLPEGRLQPLGVHVYMSMNLEKGEERRRARAKPVPKGSGVSGVGGDS
jgi:ribosomal protein S18 acetylase RimI-like enzyme